MAKVRGLRRSYRKHSEPPVGAGLPANSAAPSRACWEGCLCDAIECGLSATGEERTPQDSNKESLQQLRFEPIPLQGVDFCRNLES